MVANHKVVHDSRSTSTTGSQLRANIHIMPSLHLRVATTLVAASLLAVAVVEHRQAAKRIGNRAQALVSDFIEIARVRALLANSVDWRATRDRVLADLPEPADERDVYRAYRQVIHALNDPHTQHFPRQFYAQLTTPAPSAAAPTDFVTTSRESGSIIRIAAKGYSSGNPKRYMADGLAALTLVERELAHATCGAVVDLSQNTGGNMYPMLLALAPLLGSGELLRFVDRSGAHHPVQFRSENKDFRGMFGDAGPDIAARFANAARWNDKAQRPIAVLISGLTASSGEAVAIALAGQPWVRTVGNPTRGLVTANSVVRLADGSAVALTVARMSNRVGHIYNGPVAPDVALPAYDETRERAAPKAIAEAVANVASRCVNK